MENDKIAAIYPVGGNMATPEGPCIKGLSYIERASAPDRIIYPLLKNEYGSFERITVEKAISIIAGKLNHYRSVYGPESVLYYKGSGMSGLTNEIGSHFWKLYGGATTTYGNLCWPAGLEAIRLCLGSVMHNVPWDMANADTIIFWGKNPAETNVQELIHAANAAKNGAKIIVIDPRRTPTADKSDIWYNINPGTDGALALSIAWYIISTGKVNKEFIGANVADFELFSSKLSITPGEAEIITGLPEQSIIELAEIIASSDRLAIAPGYGLQRYSNGGETIRAILSLLVITGNLGREGCGLNYANLQSYVFDDLLEPLSYYPDNKKDKPFRRTVSMTKLGADMNNLSDPPLKMIWVERGNPLTQSPNSVAVKKAFDNLEFKVVVDQFMTDTAAEADLVLPAKNMFEQSDVIGSYWSPYVQFKPAILDPPGDVLPESEIYYRLAEEMGIAAEEEQIPKPGKAAILKWLRNRMNVFPGIDIESLEKGPVIPENLQEIAYSDGKWKTPSGKIELCPLALESLWGQSRFPGYTALSVPDADRQLPFLFCSPNIGSRIHSQFGNLQSISLVADKPSLEISVADGADRNIATGDAVTVRNSMGEFTCKAKVTNRVRPGMAIFPNGIWKKEGGSSNFVTYPMETDIGYGAAFHNSRVDIIKEERE